VLYIFGRVSVEQKRYAIKISKKKSKFGNKSYVNMDLFSINIFLGAPKFLPIPYYPTYRRPQPLLAGLVHSKAFAISCIPRAVSYFVSCLKNPIARTTTVQLPFATQRFCSRAFTRKLCQDLMRKLCSLLVRHGPWAKRRFSSSWRLALVVSAVAKHPSCTPPAPCRDGLILILFWNPKHVTKCCQ